MKEIAHETDECELRNVIHAAKLQRMANAHANLASKYRARMKEECHRVRKTKNSNKADAVKNMAKELRDNPAQPLRCIERDQNTRDGGQKGEMTADPKEIDNIVKRAWKRIYDGAADCLEGMTNLFFSKYH